MKKKFSEYIGVMTEFETKVPTKNILLLIPIYSLSMFFFIYLPSFLDYEIIKTYSFIPVFISMGCVAWLTAIIPLNIAKNKGLITNEKQFIRWLLYLMLAWPIALIHVIFTTNKLKS